jgi:uncharacterized protein (DUF608 family)
MQNTSIPRRHFLGISATAAGALTAGLDPLETSAAEPAAPKRRKPSKTGETGSSFDGTYAGDRLNRTAFPMGGIGAGMICLEGTGALSHVSLKHKPEVFHEPCMFASILVKGPSPVAKVLEGPVPAWKLFGAPGTGNGAAGSCFGLPRFRSARMQVRFPFASVTLADAKIPLSVELTGWSPFVPGDSDASSLPVAALEYRLVNPTDRKIEGVLYFSAKNFMVTGQNPQAIRSTPGGFVLWGGAPKEKGWEEGAFAASVSDPGTRVDHAWFRGGWWDPLTMAWNAIAKGKVEDKPPVSEGGSAPGATLAIPFEVAPKGHKTIVVRLAWYVGNTNLRLGNDPKKEDGAASPTEGSYKAWYTSRFRDIQEVMGYWNEKYAELRGQTQRFTDCFYDTTLPPEVVDAVSANLTILKSPTVLRQSDGRLWAWEGCGDNSGCCHGSCTHVWNYAQAIPHLFPSLERTLRQTEFEASQKEDGHQAFRSALPIRPQVHDFHAAADGQLGGIMKAYREWRISGDLDWLRGLWPKVKASLNYCIETWDPSRKGVVEEPHHNTYDIEFWGPDGMCTSFYLGALQAAVTMGKALGDPRPEFAELLEKGTKLAESELYDGEYFIQRIEWKNLKAKNPLEVQSFGGDYSPEARELLAKEGPKYQYGTGCLADGVLGSWLAMVCGVGQVLDAKKVRSHLVSVHKYNLLRDLSDHANPQRPSYACGAEGGLLICTWPKGGALSLPFVYSNEVWTGIEYQVASHLILMGRVEEGLEIVRVCRARYDGRIRNPFNEYECGHWYARAMSSYALLQSLSGARYDAVEKVLYLEPRVSGDFRAFLSTATGFGSVGVRKGKPFYEARSGQIDIRETRYQPFRG